MKNFVQPCNVVTITAPSGGTVSGRGVLVGSLFGIATTTTAAGSLVEVLIEGGVNIAKTSALVISVGDRLYWDDTNKVVNKTATAQVMVGIATGPAVNPSGTVWMKLTPGAFFTAAA